MPRIDIETLLPLTRAVHEPADEWRQNSEDGLRFLRHMEHADDVVVYASGPSFMLHGVLMPARKVTPEFLIDAQRGHGPDLQDTWRIQRVIGGRAGYQMFPEAPLADTPFAGGEKLVFRRDFRGMDPHRVPLELGQKLVHSLDVHYIEEQRAYCRLDEHGDLDEVIRLLRRGDDAWTRIEAVTIRRTDLEQYMALTGTVLVLRFDFTRHPDEDFMGFHTQTPYERESGDAAYHGAVTPQASYCNGVFRLQPRVTRRQLIRDWKRSESPKSQQYVSFIVQNLRDGEVVEVSCSPGATANYFQESDKPLELSPAFFRPDVLSRYKADPDKYDIRDRDITCRGTWTLRGTDANEAGQVHAYLCDLRKLPYSEQLYWRSFNQPPRGGISARAVRTDFLGQWDISNDPLSALRDLIRRLDESGASWWKPRGATLHSAVHLPLTQSSKEWRDAILALDQLVVEGLVEGELRKKATTLGRTGVDRLRSLRILEQVLIGIGESEEVAARVTAPLARLRELRNHVAGHATGSKGEKELSLARREEGGLPAHFGGLLEQCHDAMSAIEHVLIRRS